MKKENIKKMIPQMLVPALLTALGVILLVSPDSATILASRIIGGTLILIGAEKAFGKLQGQKVYGGWLLTFVCCFLGLFIMIQPLVLAEALGRFLGILLVIRGVGDVKKAAICRDSGLPYKRTMTIALITAIAGFVLAALPMTLTRTILRLCGLAVGLIGIMNILEKSEAAKQLEAGDPNIIDADV